MVQNKDKRFVIYLVIQIIIVLLAIAWVLICLMPDAMSLAAGLTFSNIAMVIALTFGPVLILALISLLMWRCYLKAK